MKKLTIYFCVIIIGCSVKITEASDFLKDSVNIRNVFLSVGIGYPSIGAIGGGFQINEDWSVAAKLNLYIDFDNETGFPAGTATYGLKITRFFDAPFLNYLNNLSVEVDYHDYKDSDNEYGQDNTVELNLGRENISIYEINLGYQIGVALITSTYITPSAKIFLTINL